MTGYAIYTLFDDAYFEYGYTMAYSFFKTNSWFNGDFIIINDDDICVLSEDNKERLKKISGHIRFLTVKKRDYSILLNNQEPLCDNKKLLSTYYKFEIFKSPYDKILWLDSDMVINKDINELFENKEYDGKFCACLDCAFSEDVYIKRGEEDYFNGGLYRIDKDFLKKHTFEDIFLKCSTVTKNEYEKNKKARNKGKCVDQDFLNYYFDDSDVLILPTSKYNINHSFWKKIKDFSDLRIFHYYGPHNKPNGTMDKRGKDGGFFEPWHKFHDEAFNNEIYVLKMKYITIADLSETIRKNFHKVPHDVDFVIGIPRSGMICASIISCMLNVPLIDVNSFCEGVKPSGGGRLRYYKKDVADENHKKILVVDDMVFYGKSMEKAKKRLESVEGDNEFVFLAVYLEGSGKDKVDIYLEDVSMYTHGYKFPVLYEWNIFHHNEAIMERCIYDIDGVLCVNPPDERNNEQYISYIKNAVPLFTPTTKIGQLFTYRLVKNQEITEKWLKEHDIHYGKLIMFKANTWDERNQTGISSEQLKGEYYKNQKWAILFVESEDNQAREIFRISGKPVFSVEANKLYSK